jgi:hypothetical protein
VNIYNLLRFLVAMANPTVENPELMRELATAKKAAYDLITQLEEMNAFGQYGKVILTNEQRENVRWMRRNLQRKYRRL